MASKIALPLLASTALASQLVNRVASPAGTVSETAYSPIWSGAICVGDNGTFTTVTGTFTVPIPSGAYGAGASVSLGIDNGGICGAGVLRTGIDFTILDEVVSYAAWYEWYPHPAHDFSGITISAGDVIRATVVATSATSDTAVIENQTTGQTVTQYLTSSYALCKQTADWLVEYPEDDSGNIVPFANFGTVNFTSATAYGPGNNRYNASGTVTILIDDGQNEQALTSVSINGQNITIKYL